MLARLILALLLAAFAFPAAAPAACHEAGAAKTVAMSHMPMPAGDHQDQKAVPPHGCIGCVPPSSWSAAPVASVAPHSGPLLIERAHVLAIGAVPGPDTPPPRIA